MKNYNNRFLRRAFILVSVFTLISTEVLLAQTHFRSFIDLFDRFNPELEAQRSKGEAQKVGYFVGLNPPDPEIGINYLRPQPRISDRRLDFSISQEFEFPTIYISKQRLANAQSLQVDQTLAVQRAELMQEALELYIQWNYHVYYGEFLEEQLRLAEGLQSASERRFNLGETNILERNKARLQTISIRKEWELNKIEGAYFKDRTIALLGGGNSVELPMMDKNFSPLEHLQPVPSERGNVLLTALDQERIISGHERSLAASAHLPTMSVGFMREQDIEVDFRGLTFGVSIPIWQPKNRLKHAKLKEIAVQKEFEATSQQIVNEENALYKKLRALAATIDELRKMVEKSVNLDLAAKSYELQNISITDYLLEMNMYRELTEQMLQAELEFLKTLAAYEKWRL